ncbi:Ribonucleoside-diphosphate reductase small chain B [Babesia sp. Xinjiang]|uniref:Ribonucleoside-diphosphate reductase small chain B n=1 Tax=Babesia sp. Xinjiang TaxID=462227 RepID=UPI000A235B8D|nr:Ribonucleoside-diphosphate reductase small chain B [Babesia sp. Xinjiang]ORM40550.1 Ribonucleoside-diphosphate reductase small chain B [Babesia sp. Xinjiang]
MELDSVQYLTPQEVALGQHNEALLRENTNRWVMFPIHYDALWAMYKEIENSFWAAEDFRFSADQEAVSGLDTELKQCIVKLISFHAKLCYSDAARPATVTLDLLSDTQLPEARAFYGFQVSYENIHDELFGTMSMTVPGSAEVPEGLAKVAWLSQKFAAAECFYMKVVLQCISKCVFRCAYGILADFLKKSNMLPTIVSALDTVAKDINIHLKFAAAVFDHLKLRVNRDVLLAVLSEAYDLEVAFCKSVLPLGYMGLSDYQLAQYVKNAVNQCLRMAGHAEEYRIDVDLGWLKPTALNFRITAAQVRQSKPKVPPVVGTAVGSISFDEDF